MYTFESVLVKENNRTFLEIPFNVWEISGKKGLIPVEVEISEIVFECKLVPKGKGIYYIPVNKKIYNSIDFSEGKSVQMKFIDQLSRINSNSPYSKEKPIRSIDSITFLKQPADGLCGQTSLAMLAGISVDEVINIMKSKKWQGSITKLIETLDYFGFSHGKAVYTGGKEIQLPKCCLINTRGKSISHLMIYYNGKYYDPAYGILDQYDFKKIICYIEIEE